MASMKQLARKPLLLSLMLSLPLWIVFDNFLVAIMAGLLIGFLVSMCHSLWVLKQKQDPDQ
ncbi:hypothetical protein GSY71_12860 [Pusillimonas sp. TS35]|uniref:hypothetical protein n=1 Tax=Paracandidimonas lactea TaxID=2895524 RepID=UPI0014252CF4|nr:hypothetical protein [Paracandidimonas lactea]MYN14029.1 hypothetical protein [Pusillimonas sp. TS35]